MKKTFTLLAVLFAFYSYAQNDIRITEISYNPPESGSDSTEYIEFYNNTNAGINLNGYTLTGVVYTFGNVTIPANDYLVVCVDSLAMQNVFGVAAYQWTSGGLSNGGEAIVLKNTSGTIVDSVKYDDFSPWPSSPDGHGPSLVLCDLTVDQNNGANWDTSSTSINVIVNGKMVSGSPGALDNSCMSSPPTSSDTTNPSVTDGIFSSATMVTIVFDEPVTAATAQDVSNYTIAPGITVNAAVLSASMDSVTLTLSPALTTGTQYTVDIMNVVDTSLNANVMNPFNTTFYFNDYAGADLMITEIMFAQTSSGVQDIDYFEIHNTGSTAIELAGLSITSGMELEINTSVSIAAGGYFVFTENLDSFMLAFPSVTNVLGVDAGSLSGGGETITISNSLGDDLATVTYATSAPWPAYTDVHSIELCDLTTDNTLGENWFFAGTVSSNVADMLYGTPGAANSCAPPPVIPTYDIAVVRTVDANGDADSLGVYCAVEGIVYGADLDGNNGISFTVIDDTRGINIFNFNDVDNYVVNEGDKIRVVGEIDQYNGLIELVADSITVLSTGHCIEYPTIVTAMDESTESEYIEIKNVVLADPVQWPTSGNNANVDFVTPNGDTLTMRIDRDTPLSDTIGNAPTGTFNLIGIGGQFSFSGLDGYQVFPMFWYDVDTNAYNPPAGIQINEIAVTNASTTPDGNGDFYQWIEIFNSDLVDADLTGYFFTNDTANVYMSRLPRCNADANMGAISFELFYANTDPAKGPRYLSTELDMNTPFIGLYTPNGQLVDSIQGFPANLTTEGYTYGWINNDKTREKVVFETGTPAASNADGVILSVISTTGNSDFKVYPNPVSTKEVFFNQVVSVEVYSISGQLVLQRNNTNQIRVDHLEKGVYLIKTNQGDVIRLVVN